MRAKQIHRLTAIILGIFIVFHLIVHLFAIGGIEAHQKALKSVQWIYRNPAGEIILVAAILIQIVSGFKRLKAKRKSPQKWAKAQVYSGLYLMVFLVVHTSAAIYTHNIHGLETDIFWAAGSMGISPVKFFFWPYYFFGITAFFVHFACALHFGWPQLYGPKGQRRTAKPALITLGVLTALAIILPISGALYDIPILDEVMEYYQKYFGILGVG